MLNEDHLSLRKDNFLVCYCRDFESHKKFVKTLTSVKPCNSCHLNKKIHEHLLRSLINSHFIDGFSWNLNGLSTWTTWLLEYNYHVIQILVSRCCLVLSQKVEFLSFEKTLFSRKKTVYRSSFSNKFIIIDTLITLLHVSISFESILYVFIPVSLGLTIIICVCNTIWRNFQRESDASQHRNGASRNRRLSKTLLLVSILALVCWLPLIIMDVLIFLTTTSIPNNFYYMVNILNYSNSFVNPIVYVFRIPEFQQALRSCRTKRRPAIKIA